MNNTTVRVLILSVLLLLVVVSFVVVHSMGGQSIENQVRNFGCTKEASSQSVIPTLIQLLQDKSHSFSSRVNAIEKLASMNEEEAVIALIRCLYSEEVYQVWSAADDALKMMAPKIYPILIKILQSNDTELKRAAIKALGRIGKDYNQVIPALTNALQDSDEEVRALAARALGYLKAEVSISALIQSLQDPSPEVRGSAVQGLGQIGRFSPEVITALQQTFKDPDRYVRFDVTITLTNFDITDPRIVNCFIEGLTDEFDCIRSFVAIMLSNSKPHDKETTLVIIKILTAEKLPIAQEALKNMNKVVGQEFIGLNLGK